MSEEKDEIRILMHDIKNVLSRFFLRLSLIEQNIKDPEILKLVSELKIDSETIKEIIENYEKIAFQKTEKREYINLKKIFQEAVSRFPELKSKEIKVQYECQDNLLLWADSRLIIILHNLIDNSLKHGGENLSKITLSCENRQNELKIYYKDNGIGVPEKEKQRIFSKSIGLWYIKKLCGIYRWQVKEIGEKGFCLEISIKNTIIKPRKF